MPKKMAPSLIEKRLFEMFFYVMEWGEVLPLKVDESSKRKFDG
jgi:hypothetical protein